MGETNFRPEHTKQQSDASPPSLAARIGLRLFGLATGLLLRILGATWRVEVLGKDPREVSSPEPNTGATDSTPQLAALFHESMLPCAWFFRDRRYSAAVSRSQDGNLIRATLLSLGYAEPSRGSSSRGGSAALLGLIRQIDNGTTVSVLVDGPRGPARVAKTGIVALSHRTRIPIQPVGFSARPAIRLKSWDRSLIPFPFARVVCAFGEPIAVPDSPDADEIKEQASARRLDERLTALHHEADRVLLDRKRK